MEAHGKEEYGSAGTSSLPCQKHYKLAQRAPELCAGFPVSCKNIGFDGVKQEYSVSNYR